MAANDIEEEIRRQMLAERAATPQAAPTPAPPDDTPAYYGAPKRKSGKGGLAGAGAALLALFAKFKFLLVGLKLLTFGKLLLTGGSMLVSMWVWAKVYGGWPLGIGIVLLIFIHECGHALAARMRGIPVGMMVFVPMMGAFVTMKGLGRNIAESAFIGIMGPVAGTLAGVVCVGIYFLTGSPFWLVLAQLNFFMNLFNLAPTPPLDGGWITPLFSPKLLAVGAVLLLFIARYNWLIVVLALLSLPRIIGAWKADPKTQPYYQATTADRWKYGLAYLGLALFLALSQYGLHTFLKTLRLPVA